MDVSELDGIRACTRGDFGSTQVSGVYGSQLQQQQLQQRQELQQLQQQQQQYCFQMISEASSATNTSIVRSSPMDPMMPQDQAHEQVQDSDALPTYQQPNFSAYSSATSFSPSMTANSALQHQCGVLAQSRSSLPSSSPEGSGPERDVGRERASRSLLEQLSDGNLDGLSRAVGGAEAAPGGRRRGDVFGGLRQGGGRGGGGGRGVLAVSELTNADQDNGRADSVDESVTVPHGECLSVRLPVCLSVCVSVGRLVH